MAVSEHDEVRAAIQGSRVARLVHHIDVRGRVDELQFELEPSGRTVIVAAHPTEPGRLDLRFAAGP